LEQLDLPHMPPVDEAPPPASTLDEAAPLEFARTEETERLTHQLFRFPAKFHPPVVRHLLEDHSSEGDTVLDPFCGSGTLLVEAVARDRHALGLDVDPVAVFVSRVKVTPVPGLDTKLERLETRLHDLRRPAHEYDERQWPDNDLTPEQYEKEIGELWVPAIPNLEHWFRRYVVVDLARILDAIMHVRDVPARNVFRLAFAATLRNASNADPVPVSGLEVTKHMRDLDADGRMIDPYRLFLQRCRRAVKDVDAFTQRRSDVQAQVLRADVSKTWPRLRRTADVVITSPPYHSAVDYYRRHQLEMFWLGLTTTQDDRLKLLDEYLGRPSVPMRHRYTAARHDLPAWALDLESKMTEADPARARTFRHYCVGMSRSLERIATHLQPGGRAVFVVGHSRWKEITIDTSQLFSELAGDRLKLVERRSYPVVNRYMSYSRRNGADIDREYVLVYERTGRAEDAAAGADGR
jgi:SAM-dependent methyltransferase